MLARVRFTNEEIRMARIVEFEELPSGSGSKQTDVSCGWRVTTIKGETLLQLDTYGSAERKLLGKVSQTVQLDHDGAQDLIEIIGRAFPDLA